MGVNRDPPLGKGQRIKNRAFGQNGVYSTNLSIEAQGAMQKRRQKDSKSQR